MKLEDLKKLEAAGHGGEWTCVKQSEDDGYKCGTE
jgi:hypothetical protein